MEGSCLPSVGPRCPLLMPPSHDNIPALAVTPFFQEVQGGQGGVMDGNGVLMREGEEGGGGGIA